MSRPVLKKVTETENFAEKSSHIYFKGAFIHAAATTVLDRATYFLRQHCENYSLQSLFTCQ